MTNVDILNQNFLMASILLLVYQLWRELSIEASVTLGTKNKKRKRNISSPNKQAFKPATLLLVPLYVLIPVWLISLFIGLYDCKFSLLSRYVLFLTAAGCLLGGILLLSLTSLVIYGRIKGHFDI